MTAEVEAMPQMHVVEKLRELPLVECAVSTSSSAYARVKGSSELLGWTLSSAEAAFLTGLGVVAPAFQRPLHAVDDTLCRGLDLLQERAPIIREPPSQMYQTAKTYMGPKVSQISAGAAGHVEALANRGWSTANHVLTTRAGSVALTGLDTVSTTADHIIDFCLPAKEDEENIHPHPNSQCEDKMAHTLHTVSTLSSKVGRRVYRTLNTQPSPASQPAPAKDRPKAE